MALIDGVGAGVGAGWPRRGRSWAANRRLRPFHVERYGVDRLLDQRVITFIAASTGKDRKMNHRRSSTPRSMSEFEEIWLIDRF